MKRLASVGLSSLVLSGCVSLLPEPIVPDALYRLQATSNEAVGVPVALPVDVTVFEPNGLGLLLGSGVVFEDRTGALMLMRQAEWSDNSSRLLQNLLLDRLAIRTPGSKGVALSENLGAYAPVELHWQVRDFVVRDRDAVVAFRVTLTSGRKHDVILQFDAQKIVSYSGAAHDQGVAALIEAARGAVDELAVRLSGELSQTELMAESKSR